MPEIDTGLGWAANSDWLLINSGTIANLVTVDPTIFPNQPLGIGSSTTDFANRGFYFSYNSDHTEEEYALAESGDMPMYAFKTSDNYAVFCTKAQGMTIYFSSKRISDGHFFTPISFPLSLASGEWYYIRYRKSRSTIDFLPEYSDVATGLAALNAAMIGSPFEKTNAGYAVGCVARWKTQAGVTIHTPVLISSVSEYTDMTTTAAGYSLAKLNILRDGIRFYMSFFDITGSAEITTQMQTLDLAGPDDAPRALETVFAYIADLDHAAILVLNSPDPYEQETDNSEEEGGDGEDLEDDPVEEETLPLPSVAGHGFCTIYVPTTQQLGQMASYLWSGAFDVDQVIKLFSNPMDSILGLSAVPVDLTGTLEQIYLGGVALTGISMPKYTGRTSVKVDFGTVTVPERWGSYLDYAPYTDFAIYLPFIGIKSIKADDIMGKTVGLMYAIDILSGGCVAYLRPAGGSVLYEWSGQCALQIPVTGRSYDNVFQSAMSVATAAVAAVAAPASAPVLSGAVASAAVQAAATKPHIERSGTVNGITGFLGQLRPYLIRTIPEAYIPSDQNKFIGYPAYINVDLATVKGYNEVDSIHLENVTATGAELEEIESILKGGVIF